MGKRYKSGTQGCKPGCSGCAFPIMVILILIVGLVIYIARMNPDPQIRVAQVCVQATQSSIPSMDVVVRLYDKDGHQIFAHSPYLMQGNQVELQSMIITYPGGVTYKLTNLQGHYTDSRLERSNPHTLIPLSKGEDGIYPFVSSLPTVTPSSNSLLLKADGHLYNIYVNAGGLSAAMVKGKTSCGLSHQAGI